MRTTRAQAAGSARAQHGPGGVDVELDLAVGRRAARTRRRRRARSRPARRARSAAARRRRAARGRAARWPARRAAAARGARSSTCSWASLEVAALAQVLVEQLHRALEHRQRRAQLVRGGGDERASRRLLAAQLLLHPAERAGEVADLVAAAVGRRRRLRALGGDPQRGALQAPEPARERAREREPERDRDRQADGGRGEERVAHEPHGGRHLGQVALRDDDADDVVLVVERHRERAARRR